MLRSARPIRRFVSALFVTGLLMAVAPAQGQYFPPGDSRAGGIRDLMLIYLGQESWTKEEFLPYVAYLGKEGGKKPLDWFYDSFLFLAYGGAPSKTTYIDGATVKTDWEFYFDQLLFCENRSLHALEACLGEVEKGLGPRGKKTPVILMLPYPSAKQRDFGDVDGDGRREDFANPEDRAKAMRWCVDQLLARWKKAQFTRIQLWGFYWMNEGINAADEAIVRATADHVHRLGFGMHWIPYFRAPGAEKCSELGFDFAVLQPNYAFMEQSGLHPNQQRLTDTARLARQYHLGIEIEMVSSISSRIERDNLRDYLIHGADAQDGYMRQAVHAYYAGEKCIAQLCFSDLPADRELYEALYQFAKGTYVGGRQTPTQQISYRLRGQTVPGYADDGRRLTDGVRAVGPLASQQVVGLDGDEVQIELDLGDVRRVEGVELHALVPDSTNRSSDAAPTEAQAKLLSRCAQPRSVELAVSQDGKTWQTVGTGYRWYASPHSPSAAVIVRVPPQDARHLLLTVRVAPGKIALLDDLELLPAANLTDQARATLSPTPLQADPTGGVLTDGLYALGTDEGRRSVRWPAGQEASIQFHLSGPHHLGLLRLHMPGNLDAVQRVSVSIRGLKDDAWQDLGEARRSRNSFALDAPAPLARELKFVVVPKPGQAVAVDEIEVYPAQNLAQGKPYDFTPELPEKYGDPGRQKLTDSHVSERGFGDGRTVGWYLRETEVTLDLGDACAVDAVRAHVEGGGYAAVHFPTRIDVLASTDGLVWNWIHSLTGEPSPLLYDKPHDNGTRLQLGWLEGTFRPTNARFVKLQIAPQGWLMLSEIEVLSHGKNVASGRGYHLRPAPTSAAPYGDTSGLLTDGILTTSSFSQHRAVGWDKGQPTVTLDLQAPTTIATVAAHVLGGGQAGVYFPKKVIVATSLDGKQWSSPIATSEHPPEKGNESLKTYMSVRFPPQRCRYVQLQFAPHGWLMLDEVEVFPPKAGVAQ
jgi:hypothetical protein